jgi:hypothetical protein
LVLLRISFIIALSYFMCGLYLPLSRYGVLWKTPMNAIEKAMAFWHLLLYSLVRLSVDWGSAKGAGGLLQKEWLHD